MKLKALFILALMIGGLFTQVEYAKAVADSTYFVDAVVNDESGIGWVGHLRDSMSNDEVEAVIYIDSDDSIVYKYRELKGSWSFRQVIVAGPTYDMDLFYNNETNNFHFAYTYNNTVIAYRMGSISSISGIIWEDDFQYIDCGANLYGLHNIASTPDDYPAILWLGLDNSLNFYSSSTNDGTWSLDDDEELSATCSSATDAYLAPYGSDDFFAFWFEGSPFSVYWSHYNSGSWAAKTDSTFDFNDDKFWSASFNSESIMISYIDATSKDLCAVQFFQGNETFGTPTTIVYSATGEYASAVSAKTGNTDFSIFVIDINDDTMWYITYDGSWGADYNFVVGTNIDFTYENMVSDERSIDQEHVYWLAYLPANGQLRGAYNDLTYIPTPPGGATGSYTINLRYYENGTQLPDAYNATIVWGDSTIHSLEITADGTDYNATDGITVFIYPIGDGKYRSLFNPPSIITPLVPDGETATYLFTIIDLLGYTTEGTTYLEAWKIVNGVDSLVNSVEVVPTIGGLAMDLMTGSLYNFKLLRADGVTRYQFGYFSALGTNLYVTLVINRPDFDEIFQYNTNYLHVDAARPIYTAIQFNYTDDLEHTTSAVLNIRYRNGTLAATHTEVTDTFSYTFNALTNTTDYIAEAVITQTDLGTLIYRENFDGARTVDEPPSFDTLSPPHSDILDQMWGAIILLAIGGLFSARNAAVGTIITGLAAAALTNIGWITINSGIILLVIAMGVWFEMGRAR